MTTTTPVRIFSILVFAVATIALVLVIVPITMSLFSATLPTEKPPSTSLKSFASCTELGNYLEETNKNLRRNLLQFEGIAQAPLGLGGATKDVDYSQTNVQVRGVDEADIVKTDGKFVYVVNQGALTIAAVDSEKGATLASRTDLSGLRPVELFLDGDRLVIFGSRSVERMYRLPAGSEPDAFPTLRPFGIAELWDVSNRQAPERIRTLTFEGSYLTSRLINGTVYLVLNAYPRYEEKPLQDSDVVPYYHDSQTTSEFFEPVTRCGDVLASPTIAPDQYVIVATFSLRNPEGDVKKKVVLSSGQNVYASTEKLYIAGVSYGRDEPILPFGLMPEEVPAEETTIVQVFDLKQTDIVFEGELRAPGHILNQFSMDEHEDVFRIATTRGRLSRSGGGTLNNLYLFNAQRELVGAIEDLAPGESIYAVRFMGERAYVVTFQKVDPLFALDLSNPRDPRVLGKLKIPGYSDYLHPYDETHLIGVGKEAVAADEGNFSWYQGMKIALFDVTDPTKPKELHTLTVGDRGTDSYALHDHKAFLFSREKNLLVLPILLAEIPAEQKQEDAPTTYGDFVYQGAFVYDVSLENGFRERGRVTHSVDNDTFMKSGYAYYGDDRAVMRSAYVGDTLFTVSGATLLANRLSDLAELARLSLCEGECPAATFFTE